MAVSTSSRFGSGAVQGVPSVAADFDKFAEHATPQHQLGYKVEDVDGNVYRYAHFGATVNRGVLVSQDVSESSLGDSDNVIVASASASDTSYGTIGSKSIEITAGGSTVIAADQYAGGKFITTDDTGEGYTYDIVGNTANSTSGSNIRLDLRQPLQVAVDGTTDFIIVGNKYANLEINTAATDNIIAGVSCSTISTASYYGWVQTKGIVGILCGGTDAIGDYINPSNTTSGAVVCQSSPNSVTVDQILGSCVVAGDSGGHGAYYINVD